MQVTQDQVLNALKKIEDPDLHRDIVSLGFVRDIRICEGNVAFEINLTTPACPVKEKMQSQAREIIGSLPGVSEVSVKMTAEVKQHKGLETTALKAVRNIIGRLRLPTAAAADFPSWNDWMMVQVVRREAEALVKQKAQ